MERWAPRPAVVKQRKALPGRPPGAQNPLVASAPLEISATRQGTELLLELAGELDLATEPLFRVTLHEQFGDETTNVTLDCSQLTFMDSSALAALLRTKREAQARGGDLILVEPRPSVERLLGLSGLDRRLSLRRQPA